MADTYYFTGKCRWAKLFKPDTKFAPGAYKVDLILDKEQIKQFKALKLRNAIKVDDDGNQFVTLSRKLGTKPWAPEEEWGPPIVVDKDGNKFEKLIGNDSELACELVTYGGGDKFMGSRLEKVVVINHVAYERPADENAPEQAPKEGAAKKPSGLPF